MNKYACRYAIVQFMPYPETGEFANVGVLLVIPQKNIFAYRLETKKTKRYTDFFPPLNKGLYLKAVQALDEELKFCAQAVTAGQLTAETTFDNFVRPLVTLLRFTQERVKMVQDTNNIARDIVDPLFARFVQHDFAKNQDYEAELQKRVTHLIKQLNLKNRFRKQKLGTELYHVNMPLVQECENKKRAINPLFFKQTEPQKIIEHGILWEGKLSTLKTLHALPKDILIPFEAPQEHSPEQYKAWGLVKKKLAHFADLVPDKDAVAIANFARD